MRQLAIKRFWLPMALFGFGSSLWGAGPQAYLQLEGILCDTVSANYPDWCAVLSFSFGGSDNQEGTASILSDINIVKPIDLGTTKIFGEFAQGHHVPNATIHFVKAVGPNEIWYLMIELTDCTITKVNYGFAQEGVSIGWSRLKMTYRQVHADGSVGGSVVFGWDRTTNSRF